MRVRGQTRVLIALSTLWLVLLLALGGWWLYLVVKLGERAGGDFARMAKWEGGTFLLLLIFLSFTLLWLYFKDLQKARSLQAFFAGLTHELKTPLASIRLQADVIKDLLSAPSSDPEKLEKLAHRMIEDTQKLETQMDKVLQLSRIERGGTLNVVKIDLHSFLRALIKKWAFGFDVQLKGIEEETIICADEFALEMIFRNLFENTRVHTQSKSIEIEAKKLDQENWLVTYRDGGEFKGDAKRLGTLFYKFDSSKGSGIGLYLIKKLTQSMGGQFDVHVDPLEFRLSFRSEKVDE